MNQVQDNYHRILERITAAAQRAGRDPDEIRLVVVTKGQAVDKICSVLEAGAIELAENYLDEGISKMGFIKPDWDLTWHMIGHVQSRKAAAICQHFDYVQSIDSMKLAQRMNRALDDLHSEIPVLLEFNVSGEESKFGLPAWQEDRWSQLLPELRAIVGQPNLVSCGLMTMAPYSLTPETARPFFQRLYRLREYLNEQIPEGNWRELSMGMSSDYEIAIEEGATIVRIGEAIMGMRN